MKSVIKNVLLVSIKVRSACMAMCEDPYDGRLYYYRQISSIDTKGSIVYNDFVINMLQKYERTVMNKLYLVAEPVRGNVTPISPCYNGFYIS